MANQNQNQNQKNEIDADSIQMDAQIEVSIKKGQFVLGLSLLLKRETRQALQDDQWELAIALLNALNLLERHHKNRKVTPAQNQVLPVTENRSGIIPVQLPTPSLQTPVVSPINTQSLPFSVSGLGAPVSGIPLPGNAFFAQTQGTQNQLMSALQMMAQLQGLMGSPSLAVPLPLTEQVQHSTNPLVTGLLVHILNHPNGSDLPPQIQEALLNPNTQWKERQLDAIAQQLEQLSQSKPQQIQQNQQTNQAQVQNQPPADLGLEGGSALQQGLERAQNRVGRAYDGAVTPEALGNQSQTPNGDPGFLSQVSQNGYAQ